MDTPDFTLPVVTEMQGRWKKIDDVSGGREAIVKASKTYLPQEPDETTKSYNLRLNRAVWTDAYNQTVDGLVGIAFSTPPSLGDDVPQPIKDACENADLTGNHFNVLMKEFFDGAVRKGINYALVEMPKKSEDVNSLADENKAGVRPYVVTVKPDNIINWRYDIVNGQIKLIQVTIREVVEEADGAYGVKSVEQYRVLRPGEWEVFRSDGKKLESHDNGTTSLDYIPLVALNLDKKSGFMQAKPPLMQLADLNIAHYQVYTDTRHSAHIASVPMLKLFGFDKEDVKKVVISANRAITSENADATAEWLSYDGSGVNLNREIMSDLERQMSIFGLSVLAEKTTDVTKYEKMIDTAQAQSKMYSYVMALKDSAENILQIMADYSKQGEGGTYELDDDLLSEPMSADEMKAWSDNVAKGQVSLETMWTMLKNGKRLPDDFDADTERARLAQENIFTDE